MPVVVPNTVVSGVPISTCDLLTARNKVPSYQRDYVWAEKQVAQLWDDFFDHYGRYTDPASEEIKLSPAGYFLGAMVVISETPGQEPFEVVDGQQRLTSLSTVASTLYAIIQTWPQDYPARVGLEQRLLGMLGKYDGGWVSNMQLPDTTLQQFFLASCLLHRSHAEKKSYWSTPDCVALLKRKKSPFLRLKDALETGFTKVDQFLALQPDPNLRFKRLEKLIVLVTEAVVVLRIAASSYSSAYAIFESLNNRGIPLSQADLIKNELLKAAGSELNNVADDWNAVRQTVESLQLSITLPDLVHYSYLSRHGAVKARDLYTKVKARMTTPTHAKAYSEELSADADALEAVTDSFDANWTNETIFMLKDIGHVLNVKMCYPFLIAAYRRHANNKKAMDQHVEAVMNFAFRFMKVMGESVESFTSVITEACALLNKGHSIEEIRAVFLKHASDAEFIEEFKEFSLPSAKLGYFTVYYLEKAQLGGTIPAFHGVDQNLEHVMPAKPSPQEWPDASVRKAEEPEIFRDYLWRVGNLLPLPAMINKSLKNKGILHKIKNGSGKDYTSQQHSLKSPREISKFLKGPGHDEWTYDSIAERQAWLADNVAASAWSLG